MYISSPLPINNKIIVTILIKSLLQNIILAINFFNNPNHLEIRKKPPSRKRVTVISLIQCKTKYIGVNESTTNPYNMGNQYKHNIH